MLDGEFWELNSTHPSCQGEETLLGLKLQIELKKKKDPHFDSLLLIPCWMDQSQSWYKADY